jgi:hypothetical protein
MGVWEPCLDVGAVTIASAVSFLKLLVRHRITGLQRKILHEYFQNRFGYGLLANLDGLDGHQKLLDLASRL